METINLYIFNSKKGIAKMKRFLFKLTAFAPVIMLVICVNIKIDPANLFKEEYEEKAVKILLSGQNVAGMTNFDERTFQKDFIIESEGCPDTIIIGSSRVMEIGEEVMDTKDFKNHGMSGAGLMDYLGIIGVYQSKREAPNRVIIGVDPWILNGAAEDSRYKTIQEYADGFINIMEGKNQNISMYFYNLGKKLQKSIQLFSLSYFQNSIKEVIHNPYTGKDTEYNFWGTYEKKVDVGIRYIDGSIEYAAENRNRNVEDVDALARDYIAGEIYQLENYTELSVKNQNLLEQMVDYFQKKNIKVIFYLPPYHPYVYHYIVGHEDYHMVLEAENYFRKLANEKKIPLYGSYDPQIMGYVEADFMDGMHLKRAKLKRAFEEVASIFSNNYELN